MEVALALLLPARLQRFRPFRIGRRVAALVDGRRGALKHVEVLGISAEVRNQLYAGGPGSDQRDPLVSQLVESAAGIPAGVVVIPARRVEHVPLEVLDSRDTGKLGPIV